MSTPSPLYLRILQWLVQIFAVLGVLLIIGGDFVSELLLDSKSSFVPANPLPTPKHIAPFWYYSPFYVILGVVENGFLGKILMLDAIVCFLLFQLTLLIFISARSSSTKAENYVKVEGRLVWAVIMLLLCIIALGFIGVSILSVPALVPQLLSVLYFLIMLFLPLYTRSWK